MQEARKVVSSPRWQNSMDATNPVQADGDIKRERGDDTAEKPETEKHDATAGVRGSGASDVKTSADEAADTVTRETADGEERSEDGTALAVEDPEHTHAAVAQSRPIDPPSKLLQAPLLTIAAACAGVAAMWSYSALEDTRAQLANVSNAKAAVEQALADAKSKLAVAEKTVADVKSAIAAATAPAAGSKAPATK